MALLLLSCLLVLSPMTEAHRCFLGNEPDQDMRMGWVTVPGDDPCDCSMLHLAGFNAAPLLHSRPVDVVHIEHPMTSDDPEVIQRHFECDNPQADLTVRSIQIIRYDGAEQESLEPDPEALLQLSSLEIAQISISLGGRSPTGEQMQTDLVFDASGSNLTSWFAYDRLLNSPWPDLDQSAVFSMNWTATSEEIFGIHAELRGRLPVEGWLRIAPPGVKVSHTWPTETPPVIATAKEGKVHWTDRDVLSRGLPATQSSTLEPGLGQYAIDLDPATRTSTVYEFEPWWMVGLADTHKIIQVTITACADGKGKTEVTGAQIRIGDEREIDEGTPCGPPILDPAREGTTVVVDCGSQTGPVGKYLSMRIDGKHGTLAFCGIVIHTPTFWTLQVELTGRPTWQSSVLHHNASLSNDGVVGVHDADQTCSQTAGDSDYNYFDILEFSPVTGSSPEDMDISWWRVDLGDTRAVSMIVVSPFLDQQKWSAGMSGAAALVTDNAELDLHEYTIFYAQLEASPDLCYSDMHAFMSPDVTLEHRPLLFQCNDLHGRYVFVFSFTGPLAMCEVEVFGAELGSVFNADTLNIQALVAK